MLLSKNLQWPRQKEKETYYSMAQPDLVAQKILNTDPNVGFGEAAVLPYRQHSLDTRGLEALERANTRKAAAEEARKKNNEDYYNTTIKNLPEYQREFEQGLKGWRDEIVNKSSQIVREGRNPSQTPEFTREVLAYTQAAKATKQINDDLEKVRNMPVSKYTNKESLNGAALKKYTELKDRVNSGDRTAFSESVIPDPSDPEHFLFDEFLNDRYGKMENVETSNDYISTNSRGERIIGKKVKAKFVTKDKNNRVVPGIDDSVIENDLYSETTDPNTLQYRNALFSLVDKQITSKALELKAKDPEYKDLGVTQIVQRISANPKDPHYEEYNRNKIAEDIHRSKLEPFQKISTDNSIGSLNEYNKDSSGDGAKKEDLKFEPAVITQNSGTGNSIAAPGVILSKKDKPVSLSVAANTIYDFGTGNREEKNTARVPINASSIGYALANKSSNKLMAFKDIDEMENYINTAPKSDLNKLNLDQYIFGNILEKKNTQGDTGEDEPADKLEQNINRSIAIKYNKDNETGAQINLLSNGAFNNRQPTADEQRIKSAWEKRMAKKETKPSTVVQNGVTYTLNQKTGQYE
jgi:hypothetical protein